MDEMVRALKELKVAFQNVNREWDSCDKMNELVKADYPFEDSFDELNIKVGDWVDAAIEELEEN